MQGHSRAVHGADPGSHAAEGCPNARCGLLFPCHLAGGHQRQGEPAGARSSSHQDPHSLVREGPSVRTGGASQGHHCEQEPLPPHVWMWERRVVRRRCRRFPSSQSPRCKKILEVADRVFPCTHQEQGKGEAGGRRHRGRLHSPHGSALHRNGVVLVRSSGRLWSCSSSGD